MNDRMPIMFGTGSDADEVSSEDAGPDVAEAPTAEVTMIDPARRALLNRVRRAQGQLGGVLRMLEEGRDPQAVLHQIKAVSSALDRAGFALVAAEWRDRVSADGEVTDDQLTDLEKLFLSLS